MKLKLEQKSSLMWFGITQLNLDVVIQGYTLFVDTVLSQETRLVFIRTM